MSVNYTPATIEITSEWVGATEDRQSSYLIDKFGGYIVDKFGGRIVLGGIMSSSSNETSAVWNPATSV